MSVKTYSSGQLAQAAGVSVRTIQYYDKRGILSPSAYSEGGRRLYTEEDLQTLAMICFLKDLDFSLEQIKQVITGDDAQTLLPLLLEDHIKQEQEEISKHQKRLVLTQQLMKSLKKVDEFSLSHLTDFSRTMTNNRAWKKLMISFLIKIAILVILFYSLVYLGEKMNWLWLNILATVLFFGACFWLITDYFRKVVYLCPHCHQTFEPNLWTVMWAFHTPKTRKLICPHCQQKSWCIEIAKEDLKQ